MKFNLNLSSLSLPSSLPSSFNISQKGSASFSYFMWVVLTTLLFLSIINNKEGVGVGVKGEESVSALGTLISNREESVSAIGTLITNAEGDDDEVFIDDHETLNERKVRVVDFQYGPFTSPDKVNIIFRSNIPLDENHSFFEYDLLIDDMIEVAKEEKLIRLQKDNIYIIDYTLLADEDPLKAIEVEYFKENGSRGVLSGHQVLGELSNPDDYNMGDIYQKSGNISLWMRDNVDDWVDELHSMLNNFTTHYNLMIVIHCKYGKKRKDRTGEMAGAYQLKYGRRSWEEVQSTNWETGDCHITFENQRALTWYCHFLQLHQGYNQLSCTHDNLNEASIKQPPLVGWDQEENDGGYGGGDVGFEIAFYVILSLFSSSVAFFLVAFLVAFFAGFKLRKRIKISWLVDENGDREMINNNNDLDDLDNIIGDNVIGDDNDGIDNGDYSQ